MRRSMLRALGQLLVRGAVSLGIVAVTALCLTGFLSLIATSFQPKKQAIAETKNFANVASLPPDVEIAPEWDACIASIQRPAAQTRIKKLLERGFHKPGDVENRLGYHVGQLGS